MLSSFRRWATCTIHTVRACRGRRPSFATRGESGQATVELALALPVVFALIMGVLELGVALNDYLTLASAAREGARAGAVYLYDSTLPLSPTDLKAANDQSRTTLIRNTVTSSMGVLATTLPNFDVNSDVAISYLPNPAMPTVDSRRGETVVVQVTFRHQLLSKVLREDPVITLRARAQARIE